MRYLDLTGLELLVSNIKTYTRKTIYIDELDTLNSLSYIREDTVSDGSQTANCAIYNVIRRVQSVSFDKVENCGILFLMGDGFGHQIVQILHTPFGTTSKTYGEDGYTVTFDPKNITAHVDGEIHTFYRIYNTTNAAWSEWALYIDDAIQKNINLMWSHLKITSTTLNNIIGEDGIIKSSALPSYIDDIVQFDDQVENITVSPLSLESRSENATYNVVYNKTTKRFVLKEVETSTDVVAQITTTYYNNWGFYPQADLYGDFDSDGRIPTGSKIYTLENTAYRWNGSDLVAIGAGNGLTLGTTSSTAYAGDKGAKNESDIAAIKNGGTQVVTPTIVGKFISNAYWDITSGALYNSAVTNKNIKAYYGSVIASKIAFTWTTKDTDYVAPTTISGDLGTTKPAEGVESTAVTTSNIKENKTLTVTFSAPKSGLTVVGNNVKWVDNSTSTASDSVNVSFVYNVWHGPIDSTFTATSLASALNSTTYTEAVTTKSKVLNSVTTSTSQYYAYAYPKALGTLSKITMNDATPLLSDGFTVSTLTVTEPKSKASVEYYVYTSVQKGAFTNAKLDIA